MLDQIGPHPLCLGIGGKGRGKIRGKGKGRGKIVGEY